MRVQIKKLVHLKPDEKYGLHVGATGTVIKRTQYEFWIKIDGVEEHLSLGLMGNGWPLKRSELKLLGDN